MAQLVADADLRGSLQDELLELVAFLRCRATEVGGSSQDAALLLSAAALHDVSASTVQAWLQVRHASLAHGMLPAAPWLGLWSADRQSCRVACSARGPLEATQQQPGECL